MGKVVFTYEPTEKQLLFHKTKSLHKLFGGAAWWGKTDALLAECLINCMRYPWVKWLFVRRTYGEIEETIAERLPKMLQNEDGWPSDAYVVRKNILHFNGWQIVLWYWQDDRKNDKYFSTEYDFIAVDELTRTIYKEADLQKLLSRNRTSKAHLHAMGFVPYFMAWTNPWWLGHQYVKKTWIDWTPRTWYAKKDFAFIPSRLEDNPYLLKYDPNYERRLNSIQDENLRKALRFGEWNIFEWQFFPEYMETQHCVPMIKAQKVVKTILCLDYGYRKPSAVYLIRRDSEWMFWITHELYVEQHTYEMLGDAIKEKYKDFNPEFIMADPAIFAKNGNENSGAETIAKRTGLRVFPADNNRQMWWNLLKTLLNSDRIWIQSNCTNLKREFWNAVYDKKKDNDLDTNGSDHALDAVRYWLMEIAGDTTDNYTKDVEDMNKNLEKTNTSDNLLLTQF